MSGPRWAGLGYVVATIAWHVFLTWSAQANGKSPPIAMTFGLSLFLGACTVLVVAIAWMVVRGFASARPELRLDDPTETLLGSAPANHWLGFEARGGKLFATDVALCFVPHRFNFDRSPARIPWSEITRVEALSTAQFGQLVVGHGGRVETLQLADPDTMAAAIAAAVNAPPAERALVIGRLRFVPEDPGRRALVA